MTKIYRNIAILILCATSFLVAFAETGVPILIQGTIKDNAGKPLGVNFQLFAPDGKIINVKSNSIAGEYAQSLVSGNEYQIMVPGYVIANGTRSLDIPYSDKYKEITYNFEMKKIAPGDQPFQLHPFKTGDTTVSDKKALNEIRNYLRVQKNLDVTVYISAGDCKFKAKKIKVQSEEVDKKGKKKIKTKTVTISAADQASDLVSSRIRNLQEYFKANGVRLSAVEFKPDSKQSADVTFRLVINKLLNL